MKNNASRSSILKQIYHHHHTNAWTVSKKEWEMIPLGKLPTNILITYRVRLLAIDKVVYHLTLINLHAVFKRFVKVFLEKLIISKKVKNLP